MEVAAKKLHVCFTHIFNLCSTEDQHSFNVGSKDYCEQIITQPMVKYGHKLPFGSWVNGQKGFLQNTVMSQ